MGSGYGDRRGRNSQFTGGPARPAGRPRRRLSSAAPRSRPGAALEPAQHPAEQGDPLASRSSRAVTTTTRCRADLPSVSAPAKTVRAVSANRAVRRSPVNGCCCAVDLRRTRHLDHDECVGRGGREPVSELSPVQLRDPALQMRQAGEPRDRVLAGQPVQVLERRLAPCLSERTGVPEVGLGATDQAAGGQQPVQGLVERDAVAGKLPTRHGARIDGARSRGKGLPHRLEPRRQPRQLVLGQFRPCLGMDGRSRSRTHAPRTPQPAPPWSVVRRGNGLPGTHDAVRVIFLPFASLGGCEHHSCSGSTSPGTPS